MINKYDFEKNEIPKREVLTGFSLFYCYCLNHVIIQDFVILRFFHTILSEFPLTGRAPCAPLCI